jgi:hypothetical protein
MNKYLTYTAMAKLQQLLKSNEGVWAILIIFRSGKFEIEYLYGRKLDVWANDILICSTPTVFTNLNTFRKLGEGSIDFDYPSDEFIITRKE